MIKKSRFQSTGLPFLFYCLGYKLLVTLQAYLKMSVDSHLETTANYIDQESYYTVEHA